MLKTGQKKSHRKQTAKMKEVSPSLSVIILHLSGLKSPIKRHRLSERIKTHDPTICCLYNTNFRYKDTDTLKVKV